MIYLLNFRFILDTDSFDNAITEDDTFSYDVIDDYTDIYEAKKKYEAKKRSEVLAQINFKK